MAAAVSQATALAAGARRWALIRVAILIMPILSHRMGVSCVNLVTRRFTVNAACNHVFLGWNAATAGRFRPVSGQVMG
jgi:hypothetical protein